jgi:zinc protease
MNRYMFSRLPITVLLLLTVTLSNVWAGLPLRTLIPEPLKLSAFQKSQATPYQQTPIVSHILANGLEIIVLEDHSIPLITIELAVKNGSYTEPPELNGLSHLYEHMFFKANRAIADQQDYLRRIGQLGISYNGTTATELVNYFFNTTSPNLETTLKIMRDAARYPLFNENEFEREREVVIGEIDRNESSPYYYLNKEMNERLFYRYPSRKNPLGSRETVLKATTDMMRLIQKRYYIPNNSALVITGDVKAEDVFKLVKDLFGDWEKGDDPFVKYPLVEHPALEKSQGLIIKQPVQNILIELGWHGPSIGKDNPATYAADVFSFILRQPDSRFQRALVDSGLVTAVGIGYLTQRNVGPITIIAQTTPDKARAALKAIYKEISHFNDKDYYTDDQLESAKALLEADDLYTREKLSEYSHSISFWWASTGLDYFRGYLGNLRKTSRADISRYVTNYIQGKPHIGLALASEESAKQSQLKPEDLIGE